MHKQAVKRLQDAPGQRQKARRADWTLTNATANQRSEVASLKAEGVPFRVRENVAARLLFTTTEEFTTDTTGGNTETFSLSHNAVDPPSATGFELYDNGVRVQADSVDYSANSFDYTNPDAAADTLTVFYVARDPGLVEIEKVAPKSKGSVSENIFEDATPTIAETDQNKDPFEFEFGDPLEGVVPKNWTLKVYVDAPAAVEWNDDGNATPQGVTASSAALTLPIFQYAQDVPGVEQAVKASALGLER